MAVSPRTSARSAARPRRASMPVVIQCRRRLVFKLGGHNLKTYAIAYLVAAPTFFLIDAVWLYLASERLYRQHIGHLLADSFNLVPAILFYLIYALGIVFFAVAPALKASSWSTASLSGACLGLVAYATYDLTNQATLRSWPVVVTLLDCAWGTFLTSIVATFAYCVVSRAIGSSSITP